MDLIKIVLEPFDTVKIGDRVTATDGGTYDVVSIIKVEHDGGKVTPWATGINTPKYSEIE
jgi:hypothetical protein